MEVTYIKKLNGSYLEISEPQAEVDICGERMLLANRMHGLLPVGVTSMDGAKIYQYDITGRQALDVLLEHKQMDEQMFVALLAGINRVAERLENYLLVERGLLLLPEFIFRDYETGEFWFCYYPGKVSETEYTFQRLTEYLLTKIDHKEEGVVSLAYYIYEEALKDGCSLSGMRDKITFFQAQKEAEERQTHPVLEEDGTETEEKITEKLPIETALWNKRKQEGTDRQSRKQKDTQERRNNNMFQKIEVFVSDTKQKLGQLSKISSILKKLFPQKKEEQEPEPFVFEPEQEEVKQGRPTTLLMTKNGEAEGILKYMGSNQLPDFKIEELPFLIGSDAACGGVLETKTVSRMHARITKLENTYYIEDLNSSNGTRVGGELLSYKKKVPLITNEIIEFADEKFRFI